MQWVPGSLKDKLSLLAPLLSEARKMFSETVRRSPATRTGHHHHCYFGARAETCTCSTLVRLMSVGMELCSGTARGQARPRAGLAVGKGPTCRERRVTTYHTQEEELFLFLCPHVQQSVVS